MMKKYFYLLFLILLPACGYYIHQKYTQNENWNYFFNNPSNSLFNREDSLFAHEFYKKLFSIHMATTSSVKHHICMLADDIVSQNKKVKQFPQKLLENELKKQCTSLALYTPDKKIFYIKNTYLCDTKETCKTILLQLDDYLILASHEVWHIQGNRLKPLDYDSFFKNTLHINHPENTIFLGFNNTGIGNNLFQYWGAYIYAKKKNKILIPIKHRPVLDIFKNMLTLPPELAKIKMTYYFFGVQDRKIDFETDVFIFNQNPIAYQNLAGYDDYIREHTQFSEPLNAFNQQIADKMQQEDSVAVHVRRGDFGSAGIPMLNLSYYDNALKYMSDVLKKPHFYIFSDDIAWCRKHLNIPYPHTFVDWNKKDYEDLHLMSKSKNFIIANSSFSWWAAFLSKNKNKIVAIPQKGFYRAENDVYSENLMAFPGCISIAE